MDAGTQLAISRVFGAPRALVYRAFTDPDQLAAWWGPIGNVLWEGDVSQRLVARTGYRSALERAARELGEPVGRTRTRAGKYMTALELASDARDEVLEEGRVNFERSRALYDRATAVLCSLTRSPPSVGAKLTLIANVGDDDWRRRGIHGEQGVEDMSYMLRKIAGHHLAHLKQLQRTLEEARWQQSRP